MLVLFFLNLNVLRRASDLLSTIPVDTAFKSSAWLLSSYLQLWENILFVLKAKQSKSAM